MRYLAALFGIVALALVVVAPVDAGRVEHVRVTIDDHFQDEFLSEECGIDVFIDVVADARATLFFNESGLVEREIDTVGKGTVTYRAPSTGNSFSFHLGPVARTDYGSGAVLGSSAIVSVAGLFGHVPGGIDSDAGLLRFVGTVVEFDGDIPIVQFDQVIVEHGNRNSGEEVVAAICAELGGS